MLDVGADAVLTCHCSEPFVEKSNKVIGCKLLTLNQNHLAQLNLQSQIQEYLDFVFYFISFILFCFWPTAG